MSTYPYPIRNRPELNLRHAIKSSISELRQLVSLTVALYLSNLTSELEYSRKEQARILMGDEVFNRLAEYFAEQIESFDQDEFQDLVYQNPLFKAQMEPLQVALELFLKLCKVQFPDGSASSRERTGLDRYPKILRFTTNAEIIRLAFQDQEADLKWVLFDWLTSPEPQQETDLSERLKRLLTIFSEETQFRLREEDNNEVFFQQEGIYKAVLEGNAVVAQDAHENVGPFRILKSFVSDSLHPFLRGDRQSVISHKQFVANAKVDLAEFKEYAGLVHNYLDIIPKRTTLTIVEEPISELTPVPLMSSIPDLPRNKILFGAPGTGKSHAVDTIYAKDYAQIRITFHPDTEYHSFVGSYKPVSDAEGKIHYSFVPQAFTNAYLSAWKQPDRAIFLIVEEINRGNCAQIFGDLFQSLDRKANCYSVYPVDADTDLAGFLRTEFQHNHTAAEHFAQVSQQYRKIGPTDFHKIILPDNLYIYATMNTSDQSLFPMDSAFKRRWDWEYIPIELEPTDENGNLIKLTINLPIGQYSWAKFLERVNKRIYKAKESEDKQLGFWFVKSANGEVSENDFVSKVLFYLWYEVFRNEPEYSIFPPTAGGTTEPFHYGLLFDKALKNELLQLIMDKALSPLL